MRRRLSIFNVVLGILMLFSLLAMPVFAEDLEDGGQAVGTEGIVSAADIGPGEGEADFFGGNSIYTRIPVVDFTPYSSNFTYDWDGSNMRYKTGGTDSWMEAGIVLPTGADLTGLRWYYYDNGTSNLSMFVFRLSGTGTWEQLGTTSTTSGTPGYGSTYVSLGETIDNYDWFYIVRINFPTGIDYRFGGIRLFWARQVSPVPGSATFGDVSTGHTFFQWIEALVAAGITSGCDASNYCPDDPVTRGQMAVFLSRALGLYWQNP